MSAKRMNQNEVEDPIKKGPLLIVSLVLLLLFLLITGYFLVQGYWEQVIEQEAPVNSGRVFLSGVAVLVLIVFTVAGLFGVLRGNRKKAGKVAVRKRKTPSGTTNRSRKK